MEIYKHTAHRPSDEKRKKPASNASHLLAVDDFSLPLGVMMIECLCVFPSSVTLTICSQKTFLLLTLPHHMIASSPKINDSAHDRSSQHRLNHRLHAAFSFQCIVEAPFKALAWASRFSSKSINCLRFCSNLSSNSRVDFGRGARADPP